jgi:septal ring factor EnvC (AmiA/AmiB activator)
MRIKTFIICFLTALSTYAQQGSSGYSRSELESRKQQIQSEIDEAQKQLDETKKNKNATMSQLHALENKLAARQRLINNVNDEIDNISSTIQTSADEVLILRETLEKYKIRYAQSIRYSFETRSSYGMLAYMFSSSSFNDAVRRMHYLKKFRDYRKQQVEQIRITQAQIEHKIGVLNTEKAQKDELLSTQMQQKQVLQKETDETNHVVQELKGKEKELVSNIEKNKKISKRLDKAISDIIRREIELARQKAAKEAMERVEAEKHTAATGTKPGGGIKVSSSTPNLSTTSTAPLPKTTAATSNYSLSFTPEVTALSNNFLANKGHLPWPVEKGFVAERFGKHQHAVAEKVTVDNEGLEIQTSAGATARVVFDGTVVSVSYIPGMGQLVVVKHGEFFTAYSRLENVVVKKGDNVSLKQGIGTVMLNDDNIPMMHFELWRVGKGDKMAPVDPAAWMAPMR